MSWYVKIPQIATRQEKVNLGMMLHAHGYLVDTVTYNEGGWSDANCYSRVLPHLKFEYESDATAFALKYGATVHIHVPTEPYFMPDI